MANQNKHIGDQLRELKKYTRLIKDASKWSGSDETIAHVIAGDNEKKVREYVYEFYCYLRIIKDLKTNYDIKFIQGQEYKNHFPKAPGSKKNFPYFSIYEKGTDNELFQVCAGVDIIGPDGVTSAPDISFLQNNPGDQPDHTHVNMIFDAKFRRKKEDGVSKGEFNDVFAMVFNLECQNSPTTKVLFDEFTGNLDLNGNCIITNGKAYNTNVNFHKTRSVKEVEQFDVGTNPKIIG